MRWRVHDTRPVYRSAWVEVWLDDVELPNGELIEHHVLKFPRASVTAVVVDEQERTLMLWRHRHITDVWGWEIPAGWAEPGENLADAAKREVEEETGYRPSTITLLTSYHALSGISTMRFTAFLATGAVHIGYPEDPTESTRVEWIPISDLPTLADTGQISDGPTLTALSYYLGIYRQLPVPPAAEPSRGTVETP